MRKTKIAKREWRASFRGVPLIPPETIEQIQAANDIVEVIGGYFPLKRTGTVYKALCPFHQERSPSFTVNPQRQIFKCFGCGAGGSVIRFVMNYENLDFVSAAKKLAERAGIKLVDAELSAEDAARLSMRRRLLALHAEAAEYFHYQLLRGRTADVARSYLKSRGVSAEVAKTWKLGYAPDAWDAMRGLAERAGFSDEELVESGLVKLRDEEQRRGEPSGARQTAAGSPQGARGGARQFYDRFRARVMFPICNDTGEVIAFSGRVLEADAKAAKYVNSPETMLFTKGAVLFGLHKSKRALIDAKSAIVCEGQLDLITAFEAGVQNVIAPQGTAFTERQAHILKRYVEEVVLCFDADAAGEKAAERSLASLLAESLVVRVAEMPPGEDPDSLIRGQGAEAFRKRIVAAKDFFDFQIDRLASAQGFATPRGKLAAARKIAESLSLVTDGILREAVLNKATQRLEIAPAELQRLLRAPKKAEPADDRVLESEPIKLDPTLRLLALVTLRDDDARAWVLEEPWNEVLEREPDAGLLVKVLEADVQPSNTASVTAFLATLEAEEEAAISSLLDEKPPEKALTIAQDCWQELERRQIRRRIEALKARLRGQNLSADDIEKWQKLILDLQKRLSDSARPFFPSP